MSDTPANAGFTGVTTDIDVSALESLASSLSANFQSTTSNGSVTPTATSATTSSVKSTSQTSATTHSETGSSATNTASPSSSAHSSNGTSVSSGVKAGIGVAIALVLVILLVATFFILRYRRRGRRTLDRQRNTHDTQNQHDQEVSCVYHRKPELDDTSTPRDSSRDMLLRAELPEMAQVSQHRMAGSGSRNGEIAELEVSL